MSVALIGLPGVISPDLVTELSQQLGHQPGDIHQIPSAGSAVVVACSLSDLADPDRRRLLREHALIVWLDGADGDLADAAAFTPHELHTLRQEHLGRLTTAADLIVEIDVNQTPSNVAAVVADEIRAAGPAAALKSRRLVETVAFDDGRSYPIQIGRGVVDLLPELISPRARKVAIVTQESIGLDVDCGREQRTFIVEDGEKAKRLETVGRLASSMAQWEMTRADVVVSIGGGVVSDLAGYLAASYHRGIPVIHVSTTLLGQIDAAIGGKCGVNLPEGKNLVGAFWQPTAVLCEIDSLSTLPPREFVSGMGELAKYHFLGGGELDRLSITDRVARSARIKADVVSGDEREGGRRALLNYGHTLAHALETVGAYDLRHGEAVAVGLIYAAELAHRLGRIDADRVLEHRRVVARYGLESTFRGSLDHQEIVDLFSRDKKAVDGITFVLDGPDGVEPVRIDDRNLLLDTLTTVTAGS